MFLRDEQFMATESGRRRTSGSPRRGPTSRRRSRLTSPRAAKVQAAMDRYFKAFEDGKLSRTSATRRSKACAGDWRNWKRRGRISRPAGRGWTYPAIDREMLAGSSTSSRR
jgi:hypothetical protein